MSSHMKSQTGVLTRQYIHDVNSVVSTVSAQAWSEQGRLDGIGAASLGPQSSWAWTGPRGSVRSEPCGFHRQHQRPAFRKSKGKAKEDGLLLFLSKVDPFLLAKGMEI